MQIAFCKKDMSLFKPIVLLHQANNRCIKTFKNHWKKTKKKIRFIVYIIQWGRYYVAKYYIEKKREIT